MLILSLFFTVRKKWAIIKNLKSKKGGCCGVRFGSEVHYLFLGV